MFRWIGISAIFVFLTVGCDNAKELDQDLTPQELPPKDMVVSKDKALPNKFEYLDNIATDEMITQDFIFKGADYSMLMVTNDAEPTKDSCQNGGGISHIWQHIRGREINGVSSNTQFQARTGDHLRLVVTNKGLCAEIRMEFSIMDMTN